MVEKTQKWLPRCLGLLVFSWYALAASPGFFWFDSAELSASAAGLGSPHPTGFPLYILLGKLASLFPIGEIAFRLNILSAVCAALAVGGVARLVIKLGKNDWPTIFGAGGGASALALSFLFARQATVAEVYAPTAALLVLTLILFDSVARGANASVGLTLAWVAGLGIGLHPSYRLLLGIPLLALFALRLYRGAKWPLLAPVFTSLSALALYLYLPVRSATGRIAMLDWGHPRTLDKLIDHANASQIRLSFEDEMMSTTSAVVYQHAATFLQQITDSLGLLCLFAAAAGLMYFVVERKMRLLGVAMIFIAVLDSIYSVWINPMGLVDQQNGLPLVLILCISAGVAIANLSRHTGMAQPFVGALLCIAIVLPPALVSSSAIAGGSDTPRNISENAMHLDPGSIVFLQSDSVAAGTSFLKFVEGYRPDVAVLVVPMLLDRESANAMLRESSPDLSFSSDGNVIAEALASRRTTYWENGQYPAPSKGLVLGPIVSKLVLQSESLVDPAIAAHSLAGIYAKDGIQSRVARRLFAHSITNLGRIAFGQQKNAVAKALFESAISIQFDHAEALVNLGVVLMREGNLEQAIALTEEALRHQPNRKTALINAARYRMVAGDVEKAEKHATRVMRVAPKDYRSWQIAGLVAFKAGNYKLAEERLAHALTINPKAKISNGAIAQVRKMLKQELVNSQSSQSIDSSQSD